MIPRFDVRESDIFVIKFKSVVVDGFFKNVTDIVY